VDRLSTWSRRGFTRPGTPHPRDFGRFYLAYNPDICDFFKHRTNDEQLSLDLTAETFARALKAGEGFRGKSGEEALVYLWLIARNLLYEHYRRGATRTSTLRRYAISRPVASEDELAEMVERRATLDAEKPKFDEALAELTPKQREVVEMHVDQEMSYEEIAAELGVTTAIARKRYSAAVRRLRRNRFLRRLGGQGE
jgi:RNA polymerase sigma factor (sigma-70 family)